MFCVDFYLMLSQRVKKKHKFNILSNQEENI